MGALWHLIVDKQVTLSAIVPAALAIELVLYRKWQEPPPVAGLLNVRPTHVCFARASTHPPSADLEGRLRTVCASVCAERINLHAADAAVH
ncbi:MAG: hypothetical protein ACLSVD_02270 [Eggerthellaceae bacterium]